MYSFLSILSYSSYYLPLLLIDQLVTSSAFANDSESFHTSSENVQELPVPSGRSQFIKIVACTVFTILSISGITGNCLVIYAIFTDPAVQTKNQLSNLAILNLAYTDLMTTSVVCVPAAIFITYDEYPMGPTFCRIWAIFNVTGIVATNGLLMVISVDRFIAVGWSLHYPQWVTYNRLMGACLFIWISSISCAIAWAMFQCAYDFWAGICDFTWQLFGPRVPAAFWYGVFCTVWFCGVPSVTMLVCNVGIIRMSREKGRVGKLEEPRSPGMELCRQASFLSGSFALSKSNVRILKAMIVVILSYFILTFPVAIIRVVKLLGGPDGPALHIPGWLTLVCTVIQFMASIVNPLIYGLLRKDFRDSYARVYRKCIFTGEAYLNIIFLDFFNHICWWEYVLYQFI